MSMLLDFQVDQTCQCDLLSLSTLHRLTSTVHWLETQLQTLKQTKKQQTQEQKEQTINSINESKKQKYITDLQSTITEITDYLAKLGKVMDSGQQFDHFIQLDKIQKMYTNAYDLLQLMDNQYQMILQGLLDKTLVKLSGNSMQVFNQFDILHIRITGCRIVAGHAEYQVTLSDELLMKHWLFYIRYSDLQKLDKHLRANVPQELLNQIPKIAKTTWFKQTDQTFILQRQKQLEMYLKTLLTNIVLLDYSSLKELFLRKVQNNLEENMNTDTTGMANWYTLVQQLPSRQRTGGHQEQLSTQFLRDVLWYVKQEIKILSWKFELIKKDIQLLDQNDTFLLMQYHKKAKINQ